MNKVETKVTTLVGSKVAGEGVTVEIELDDDAINQMAEGLANSLLLRVDNIDRTLSREELEQGFAYSLKVILYQDSGAKPSHEAVPMFLMDLIMPLRTQDGGVRITVNELEMPERPDSYGRFLSTLDVYGIHSARMLKVDPVSYGRVLLIGFDEFRDVDAVFSKATEISLEEVMVRNMIALTDESEDRLSRAIGHLDYHYGDIESLVRQWTGASAVANI